MAKEIDLEIIKAASPDDTVIIYASTDLVSVSIETSDNNPLLNTMTFSVEGTGALSIPLSQGAELFATMGASFEKLYEEAEAQAVAAGKVGAA